MSEFSRLLAYFADSKVEALVLQSERAIAVRIQGQFAALSPTPLADPQLRQLLYTSPLAPQLDALHAQPIAMPIEGPQGVELIATLTPRRDGLHCAITRVSIPPGMTPMDTKGRHRQPTPTPRRPTQPPQGTPGATRRPTLPPTQPTSTSSSANTPSPRRATQTRQAANASTASPKASPHAEPSATWKPHRPGQVNLSALESLLSLGREQGASDIHIVSDTPLLLRIRGSLERHGSPIEHRWVNTMIEQMLEDRDKEQFEARGYADFALEKGELGRFRVNVCRHKRGVKACLRVLPTSPPSLDELGLPKELSEVLKHHQGLAIIAGPNGQGKSTTLAALVNKLNRERAIHIITVEDPIEIVHPIDKAVISQRQVGRDTKSFQSALKAALREDPDVIVLGELRDRETVEMALSAAETGHLVIATMNTPSGAKTISRLIDLFPPDDQSQVRATLAGTLMVVAAQRLVPRADQAGMVAAVELITGGVPLWSLIRDDKLVQLPGLMQRGRRMGMIQLEASLRQLRGQGIIDQTAFEQCLTLEKGPQAPKPETTNHPAQAQQPENSSSPARRKLFRRKSA